MKDGWCREVPLAANTLLGRHASCTWVLNHPQVAAHWLEIRWQGSAWAYRALSAATHTYGPGARDPVQGEEWHLLSSGSRTIRGPAATVRLACEGPPMRFAVVVDDGALVEGDALEMLLDQRPDGLWPISAAGEPDLGGPLRDGEVFVALGQRYRLHLDDLPAVTDHARLDLQMPSIRVSLSRDQGQVRFAVFDQQVELSVRSAAARMALPYALARLQDCPLGGWLSVQDTYAQWRELGGRGERQQRVAEDRNRLCRELSAQGLGSVKRLFATRHLGGRHETRLALEPAQIEVLEP